MRTVDAPTMHSRTPDPDDNDDLFCEVGPYDSTSACLSSMLDRHRKPKHPLGQAIHEILRLFIGWVSSETSTQSESFTLVHPDFNLQNVLVGEDGTVKALIDWDGVATVPSSLGCPFPKWLTLDWDRFYYNFNKEIDSEREDRHHSPEEMKHYRALYAHFIEEATSEMKERSNTPYYGLAEITRQSILIDSVNRATKNPFSTSSVVFDILEKIAHLTSQSFFEVKGSVPSDDENKAESCESSEKNDTAPIEQSSSAGSSDHRDSDLSVARWVPRSDSTSSEVSFQQTLSLTKLSHSASLSSSDSRSSSQEQSSNTSSRTSDPPSHSYATSPILMHGAYSSELKLSLGKNQEANKTSDSQIGSSKPKQNQITERKAVLVSDVSLSLLTGCPEAIHSPAQAGEVQSDSSSPTCEVPVIRLEPKVGLRQRLKKLAIEKGKAINARSLVLLNLSASSKGSEDTPARGKTRRRRVIEWIKNTGHMSGNDTGSSYSAERVNLDFKLEKTLPEVPQVSDFDLLNTGGPNVETDADEAGANDVVRARSPLVPQLNPERHLKMPCYDAGEPVDDDKLYDEGFTPAQICYALMDGTLDEARMQRLKQGFAALLDSL